MQYRDYIPSHRWVPRAPGEWEALKRARAIVADPERWTVGTMARDVYGRETGVFQQQLLQDGSGVESGAAVSFSALGACKYEGLPVGRAYELLYVQPWSPVYVERLGYGEVLAMFDRAIAAADPRSVAVAA